SVPAWVGFVQPLLTDQLSDIRSASTSALLLLRTSDRIFALTFGYGRSLLDLSKIEYQFGGHCSTCRSTLARSAASTPRRSRTSSCQPIRKRARALSYRPSVSTSPETSCAR
ncbi:TIGR04141 family sporadically distributed protein, partial [Mycolicibacterium moriokaense]|uniref:DUF6119 family protein n=1 Tax=Mycolicibacterium moriokaense TaxID=39691 RepID=UPI002AEAA3CE|nr:TIGR04141 family sporadically distributed protein [Mycolicibacterium moriokaense]